MNAPPRSPGRLAPLDGLRAIAITLVVNHHVSTYLDDSLGPLKFWMKTGWNGVYLFFVLSGFLIGSLALREIEATGRLSVRTFWARRFFRTWPLYFVVLFLQAARYDSDFSPSLWHYLTFTQNLFEPKFFLHSWSLAVEEQFYLVFPLAVAALARWGGVRSGAALFGLVWLSAYWYRTVYGFYFYPFFHTLSVVDSLALGVALSWVAARRPSLLEPIRKRPHLAALTGIGLLYVDYAIELERAVHVNLLFGGQAVGFSLLLVASLSDRFKPAKLLSSRPLGLVALVSYGVYLTHDVPLYYLAKVAEGWGLSGWGELLFLWPTVAVAATAVGWGCHVAVERPALRLRDRLFPAFYAKNGEELSASRKSKTTTISSLPKLDLQEGMTPSKARAS